MVIGIIGESCTGKSSIANEISKRTGAKTYTGKDYIKLAKNEGEAINQFKDLLSQNESSDENTIYVITETEQMKFLPPKAIRVLMTADLGIIKDRFTKRMHGNLPPPVAAMLEKKHGMFGSIENDLHIHNAGDEIKGICDEIINKCGL